MRVGVVGGGQLGRMLGLAGVPLGCSFTFLDPSSAAGAGAVGRLIVASYDDDAGLNELASSCDVVTYEFENVPAEAARRVVASVPVFPPPRALELTQDRATEKELFDDCGLAVAPYRVATGIEEIAGAVDDIGLPAIVKTRREGYDGKGQVVIRSQEDIKSIDHAMSASGVLIERLVDLRRELSIIGVRSRGGEVVTYPLVENLHHEGILRVSRAPAPGTDGIGDVAEKAIRSLMDELGYVGVLTMELFETEEGDLLGNEMAPRVHNSGHWTIEGAETSQFENHIRAVTGRPLGSTAARGYSAMANLIGEVPDPNDVLAVSGAHLHLYDKEPRAGRKLGHITVRRDSPAEAEEGLQALRALPGVYLGEPDQTLL